MCKMVKCCHKYRGGPTGSPIADHDHAQNWENRSVASPDDIIFEDNPSYNPTPVSTPGKPTGPSISHYHSMNRSPAKSRRTPSTKKTQSVVIVKQLSDKNFASGDFGSI